MKRFFCSMLICCTLIASMLIAINLTEQAHAMAPQSLRHSTPNVQLVIKYGRIYFVPNHITCSHTAKPCFTLTYVSNDGPRPIWLNASLEYTLMPHQTVPFTFIHPGIEKFTLFRYSPWWKIYITVV